MSKQGKNVEKADAILQAATELFAEKDFHAVLMDEVAVRAGVGKGTLYRYFPTKDELYVSTIVVGWDRLREELESTLRDSEPLVETLENLVRHVLGFFWQRRQFIALVYRLETSADERAKAEWQQRRESTVHLIAGVLKKRMLAGALPPSKDLRLLTELFLGMVRAAILYRGERDTPEELAQLIATLFFSGLRGRAWRDPEPDLQPVRGERHRERKVAVF